jgi:A/G-specific adenine glycosylase
MPVLEPHTLGYHSFTADEIEELRSNLLAWYHQHRRRLPWRGDAPPYGASSAAVAVCNPGSSSRQRQQRDTKGSQRKHSSPGPLSRYLTSAASSGAGADGSSPSSATAASAPASQSSSTAAAPCGAPVSAYAVWVSEVMLQQTRVETVIDYYRRWMARFPTVASLASASLAEVNACWAGLGYYRRARLLHSGAQHVQAELGGCLPSTAASLLSIPGIGPYTAGAIASIAYSLPEPLIDGNVMRVLCRLRAVDATVKNRQASRLAWLLAAQLVRAGPQPGAFNQAVMELGATVCTPKSPRCADCPVNSCCRARAETQQSKRPIAAVWLHGRSGRRGQVQMEEEEETEKLPAAGKQKAARRVEIDLEVEGEGSVADSEAVEQGGRVSRVGMRKRKAAVAEQSAATLRLDGRRCDICDCSRERSAATPSLHWSPRLLHSVSCSPSHPLLLPRALQAACDRV